MASEMEPKMEEGGASSLKDTKKEIPGTPTPERCPSSPSSDSNASDDTCSICLGHITEKCVADSCLHSFCLVCLKEWSKQKAVCPLCKLSFTKIMFEIKSDTEFKEWIVPRPDPSERHQNVANFQEFLDAETRRFFGYRTTNFPGAATLRRLNPGSSHTIPDAIPSLPRQRRSRYSLRGSAMFRLSVYLNNIWVEPLADVTGRYRQTSPQLYREQPALTHRLVPWVNRELIALLPPSRVGSGLTEVMDLIERHPINSSEFRATLQPLLNRRTRHFVHEFYHFARSPYDMVGHDNAAQYIPRYGREDSSSDIANSDDSDAVIEVDSSGNPIASTSAGDGNRGQSAPGNVVREETLTQEGSVVISSSESSESEIEETRPQNGSDDYEMTQNPEPPLSAMRRLIGRAMDFLGNVNEGASTSRTDSTSTSRNVSLKSIKTPPSSCSEDSDACIIVEEVAPKATTPELIQIDSDHEHSGKPNSRQSSKPDKKLQGKSKPSLKRNNFSGMHKSNRESSLAECSSTQQDHSYCTEDSSIGTLPSTSSTAIPISENSHTKHSNPEESQNESDLSDPSLSDESDTNEVAGENSSYNASEAGETKPAKQSMKRKYSVRNSSPDYMPYSSRKWIKMRDNRLSVHVPRKDIHSRVKSSFSSPSRTCSDRFVEQRYSSGVDRQSRDGDSESDDSSWVPSKVARLHEDHGTSDESENESRSLHHRSSTKYKISSKTKKSRKHRRRSKDSHREKLKDSHKEKLKESHKEKLKKSSKKKKHRRKSKSKRRESHGSSAERSERKKHRTKSRRKTKRSAEILSDTESSSSYVKYRQTTVKVRIVDDSSSSSSSEIYL